ncbi:MAG: hypothetical protein WEC84_03990 [Candidatus Andersenbacteria bacterium]
MEGEEISTSAGAVGHVTPHHMCSPDMKGLLKDLLSLLSTQLLVALRAFLQAHLCLLTLGKRRGMHGRSSFKGNKEFSTSMI